MLVNVLHGTACFARAGKAYVVVTSTGRAVEGSYQGIDFTTPHGRRLYVTRAQPAAWALLDTTGQLRTAWIPGTGYPTRQGWLLSRQDQTWTLRDSTGRVAYTSATQIEQPASDQQWRRVQYSLQQQDPPYWQLPLVPPRPIDRAAFFVPDATTQQVRVLDARLRQLGVLPRATSTTKLQLLGSGWAYLMPTTSPGEQLPSSPDLPATGVLLTEQGQRLVAPTGIGWAYFPNFDYTRAWRQYGVLPTSQGYRTRGGRQLWQ